jgi:hypothetical protein
MNIHTVLVNWIIAFLSGRFQRVKLGGCTSCWIDVKAGVPQGTKLGPLTISNQPMTLKNWLMILQSLRLCYRIQI